MKKLICMILSIATILSMGCMLGGCNTNAKKIIGTWRGEVDITQMLNEGFTQGLGKDAQAAAPYFDLDNYKMVCVITFHEDGTYTKSIDQDSLETMLGKLRNDITQGLRNYFRDTFKKQGLNGSVDDLLLKTIGMNLEAMVSIRLMPGLQEITKSVQDEEGRYVVQDNMIFYSKDKQTEPDGKNYDTFRMYKNTLILEACFCQVEPKHKEYNDQMYPMALKKQES